MDDLYKEIILDRYQNPQNRGKVEGGVEAQEANYLCGDKLKIGVKIKKGVIKEARFEGGGCAISLAAVDLLLDKIVGMSLEEVKNIKGEKVEEMLGVKLAPARKKCAYLGLEVLKKIN
jgi:nitrogen fixation NifU-like protein